MVKIVHFCNQALYVSPAARARFLNHQQQYFDVICMFQKKRTVATMLWSRCVSQKSPKKIAVEPGNAETQKPKERYQTWKSYMSASTVNCSTLPETNIAHENLIFPCEYHQTWWVFMVFHVRSRSPFPEKKHSCLVKRYRGRVWLKKLYIFY